MTELVLGAETEWGWDNLECLPRFKGRASVTLDTLNLEVCSEEVRVFCTHDAHVRVRAA